MKDIFQIKVHELENRKIRGSYWLNLEMEKKVEFEANAISACTGCIGFSAILHAIHSRSRVV